MYYFCNDHFQTEHKELIVKVTILQTDIKWAQAEQNQAAASKLISDAQGSDLYVLPEMWSTGFMTEPKDCAENAEEGGSFEWMKHEAHAHDCAVCGSLAVMTRQGELRNRNYFVLPDGERYHYDKHHLFSYGGEDRAYTAGKERAVAEYRGFRFLLLTCYDLRFPLWGRYKGDYDAVIFVANWPQSRREAWMTLLKARAIENQCYVIGANRTGADPTCAYSGDSAIIDPKGRIMAQAVGNGEQAVTADISIDELKDFRRKFPVLADRDLF